MATAKHSNLKAPNVAPVRLGVITSLIIHHHIRYQRSRAVRCWMTGASLLAMRCWRRPRVTRDSEWTRRRLRRLDRHQRRSSSLKALLAARMSVGRSGSR